MKLLLFLFPIGLLAQAPIHEKPIEEAFPLKWKRRIGVTTFRTNLTFAEGAVYVGSNGSTREAGDGQDGVYKLDPATGKVLWQTQKGKPGGPDADVNGLVVVGERVYFGNDAGEFFCVSAKDGKTLWKKEVKASFEGVPAFAEAPGYELVFAATKHNEFFNSRVIAFSATDGDVVWEFVAPHPGDFMASPLLVQEEAFQLPMVVIGNGNNGYVSGAYGGELYAFDGETGKLKWQYKAGAGIHSSPVLDYQGNTEYIVQLDAYGTLYYFDLAGELQFSAYMGIPEGGISGIFGTPAISARGNLLVGTSWWGEEDGTWFFNLHNGNDYAPITDDGGSGPIELPLRTDNGAYRKWGRISASPVSFQNIEPLTPPLHEFFLPTEGGQLLHFMDNQTVAQALVTAYTLPAGAEATPLLADIDGNGLAELLIACLDGYLYCYATDILQENIRWGDFRGPNNAGHQSPVGH